MDPEYQPNLNEIPANRLLTDQEFDTLNSLKQSGHHDVVMGLFRRLESELVRQILPGANPEFLQVVQGQSLMLASIRTLFEMEDQQAVQSNTVHDLFGSQFGTTPEQLMPGE